MEVVAAIRSMLLLLSNGILPRSKVSLYFVSKKY